NGITLSQLSNMMAKTLLEHMEAISNYSHKTENLKVEQEKIVLSSTDHCSLANFKVYSTKGDGRCFFRSISIGLLPELQLEREDGTLKDQKVMLLETCKADSLRSEVVGHCLKNYENFEKELVGEALSADMPENMQFKSLFDRLEAVARTSFMI
ncbi:hypothetical protein BgiBS90_026089, partial [Biomphalaria glabrata]